jgi:hypothetical protein
MACLLQFLFSFPRTVRERGHICTTLVSKLGLFEISQTHTNPSLNLLLGRVTNPSLLFQLKGWCDLVFGFGKKNNGWL